MDNNIQQVRCFCCGAWQRVADWDRKTRIYCDHCRVESDPAWRSGPGRGQCQACQMSQTNHWHEPKPALPILYACIR